MLIQRSFSLVICFCGLFLSILPAQAAWQQPSSTAAGSDPAPRTGPPGAFSKLTPANVAVGQPNNLTLTWQTAPSADSYFYCLDDLINNACTTGWVGTGTNTSVERSDLDPLKQYEWQVYAHNSVGDTTANDNTWWTFTTRKASSFNILQDPSFEDYTPNTYWDEFSTNFDTPLCTVSDCDDSPETATARTGLAWAWFGGISADETASVSQDVIIPIGADELSFYFWIGSAESGSDAGDVFTAQIDGDTLFSANATQTETYSSYTLITRDISSYADGTVHTVLFLSVTTTQNITFNLDDVAIEAPVAGDIYEPDDTYTQANVIISGVPQDHSIDPAGDHDWVSFTLTGESAITLLTDGEEYYDTRLYLYDNSGSVLIEYDDNDAAVAYYSLIDRECEVDALPAGTYYVMVDESGDDELIPAYSLSFTASACPIYDKFFYLPLIMNFSPTLLSSASSARSIWRRAW